MTGDEAMIYGIFNADAELIYHFDRFDAAMFCLSTFDGLWAADWSRQEIIKGTYCLKPIPRPE